MNKEPVVKEKLKINFPKQVKEKQKFVFFNENKFKLPEEILLNIFSFLDMKDLIAVGNVAKDWQKVSQDNFLWWKILNQYSKAIDLDVKNLNFQNGFEYKNFFFMARQHHYNLSQIHNETMELKSQLLTARRMRAALNSDEPDPKGFSAGCWAAYCCTQVITFGISIAIILAGIYSSKDDKAYGPGFFPALIVGCILALSGIGWGVHLALYVDNKIKERKRPNYTVMIPELKNKIPELKNKIVNLSIISDELKEEFNLGMVNFFKQHKSLKQSALNTFEFEENLQGIQSEIEDPIFEVGLKPKKKAFAYDLKSEKSDDSDNQSNIDKSDIEDPIFRYKP